VWAEYRDFIYKNSVRTSQETNRVSATNHNWLMLFGETVAIYCENHTEHTNTLCGQNAVFLEVNVTTTNGSSSPISCLDAFFNLLFLCTVAKIHWMGD
jgi:hypothetical protein